MDKLIFSSSKMPKIDENSKGFQIRLESVGRMQGRSEYFKKKLRESNKDAIIVRKGKNIYMPARHTKTLIRDVINMEEE